MRDGGRVPWYVSMGVSAVACAYVGGEWDVSWHRSIGRDGFWTPPHVLIYLCAVLGLVVGLALVVGRTRARDTAESVSFFGLRGPLGIFVAGWGGAAMLMAAPFDQWWHNAYGLDVKMVSPPHVLLIGGLRAIAVGMLLLLVAAMNRAREAGGAEYGRLRRLVVLMGGLLVASQMYFVQEYVMQPLLHRASAYEVMAVALPVVLAAVSVVSGWRWAATAAAGIYMAMVVVEIGVLPLFPAAPRLGPVFYNAGRMLPSHFPVLLVPAAVALDVLWARAAGWRGWVVAAVSGVVFVAVLVAFEWPFADFLMTRASENRFFGTGYFGYAAPADGLWRTRVLSAPDHGLRLVMGLGRACVVGAVSVWVGRAAGSWMRGVRR